tara:strand:- start:1456 stop:1962 length:507 start_codon:yes stop_codon:yes gene_type:complete
MKRTILILLFLLLSISVAQVKWYNGNLNGIQELSISINLDGLTDELWQKKILNFIELSFLQTKINVDQDIPIPRLVVDIYAIDSRPDETSSYMINYAIYDYGISESEYIRSLEDTVIARKLRTYKIYEREMLGQSTSENIRLDIEKAIMVQTSLFIDQWFRDNPFSQF